MMVLLSAVCVACGPPRDDAGLAESQEAAQRPDALFESAMGDGWQDMIGDAAAPSDVFGLYAHPYDIDCVKPLFRITEAGIFHLPANPDSRSDQSLFALGEFRSVRADFGKHWVLATFETGPSHPGDFAAIMTLDMSEYPELQRFYDDIISIVYFEDSASQEGGPVYSPDGKYTHTFDVGGRRCAPRPQDPPA